MYASRKPFRVSGKKGPQPVKSSTKKQSVKQETAKIEVEETKVEVETQPIDKILPQEDAIDG